jgi:hypothetical protein
MREEQGEIEWDTEEPVEERLLWWRYDKFHQQRGWANGKLEFLLRRWESGRISLYSPGQYDPKFLGTFQTQEIAKEWASEFLEDSKSKPWLTT